MLKFLFGGIVGAFVGAYFGITIADFQAVGNMAVEAVNNTAEMMQNGS